MKPQKIDRIEKAIRHIESSLDVDPWACEIAVEAMKTQLSAEGTTSDLISRQDAIDRINKQREHLQPDIYPQDKIGDAAYRICAEFIERLPSAQPEIVRCKECKWYELPSHKITENCVRWMKSNGILLPIKPNDYCSYAERRIDG